MIDGISNKYGYPWVNLTYLSTRPSRLGELSRSFRILLSNLPRLRDSQHFSKRLTFSNCSRSSRSLRISSILKVFETFKTFETFRTSRVVRVALETTNSHEKFQDTCGLRTTWFESIRIFVRSNCLEISNTPIARDIWTKRSPTDGIRFSRLLSLIERQVRYATTNGENGRETEKEKGSMTSCNGARWEVVRFENNRTAVRQPFLFPNRPPSYTGGMFLCVLELGRGDHGHRSSAWTYFTIAYSIYTQYDTYIVCPVKACTRNLFSICRGYEEHRFCGNYLFRGREI